MPCIALIPKCNGESGKIRSLILFPLPCPLSKKSLRVHDRLQCLALRQMSFEQPGETHM